MITAAALTFPRFHACVTSLSGQPDASARQTDVTCSNATQITIYNCRSGEIAPATPTLRIRRQATIANQEFRT
jgi:hypothetical protein